MLHVIEHVFLEQSLVAAFAVVGMVMWASHIAAKRLTGGRVHGSAIAIVIGPADKRGWPTFRSSPASV